MRTVAAFCGALCVSVVAVSAQVPGTDDPDFKEVQAYRLTVPAMNKVIQATKNIFEGMKSDPRYLKQQKLKAEIKALEDKSDPTEAESERLEKLRADLQQLESSVFNTNDTKTLSGMAKALQKEPVTAKALSAAGLEPREYAKFTLAYFQAAMVQGMVKEVPKNLEALVNMENVKFIQEHEAEVTAFGKTMEALAKANK
jgi:hypothetical protein